MVPERNRATSSWVDCRHALASRWPLILLVVSGAFFAGAWLGSREGAVYEASTRLALLSPVEKETWPRSPSAPRPAFLNELHRREASLRSGVLLLRVIDSNNLQSRWNISDRVEALRKLRDVVSVRELDEPGLYRVRARAKKAKEAALLANAVADEFVGQEAARARKMAEHQIRSLAAEIDARREKVDAIEAELLALRSGGDAARETDPVTARDLRRRLVNASNIIRSLEAKHQAALVALQEVEPGVTVARKASPDEARRIETRWRKAGWMSLGGFALIAGLVILLSSGRSPHTVIEKITKKFDFEVAGMAPIPHRPLPRMNKPSDTLVEPYRDLRTQVHRLPAADCLVLTLVPEHGSLDVADVTLNLASVLADAGHTVLLIDADLRAARIHRLLDASLHPGLTDYLTGEMRLEETVFKTRHPNLWCMPGGPMVRDPASLFGGKRMEDLFWDMRSRFEYILLTAPAIQACSDAGVIGGFTDHLLLVSPYATHSHSQLERARLALETSGASVAGVILSYEVDDRTAPSPDSAASHHAPASGSGSKQTPTRGAEIG